MTKGPGPIALALSTTRIAVMISHILMIKQIDKDPKLIHMKTNRRILN